MPRHHDSGSSARPFQLYAVGHGLLLAGAGVMHLTGSMLPMALGASAGLMLNVPLLRQLVQRGSRSQRTRREL